MSLLTLDTTLTTKCKSLMTILLCLRRTLSGHDAKSSLKLSGCVCMMFGSTACFTSTLTARLSSHCIVSSIANMFWVMLSPFPAIKYDHNLMEHYSCQPYHLNVSKDLLPLPLLSQLLSHAPASSPLPSMDEEQSEQSCGDSQDDSQNESESTCLNWNLGSCNGDTCDMSFRLLTQ